ncbi:MAG: hypothetical protein HYY13_07975 [Nitrospirae bacterium]|nr:hypothetical protein [Nitrospirota bacterium]
MIKTWAFGATAVLVLAGSALSGEPNKAATSPEMPAAVAGPPSAQAETTPVPLASVAADPAAYENHTIMIEGLLRNAGSSYFKGARFEITDVGRSLGILPWLPLETAPPRPGISPAERRAVMSDFLSKRVRLEGAWKHEDGTWKLHVKRAEILPEPKPAAP